MGILENSYVTNYSVFETRKISKWYFSEETLATVDDLKWY